MARGGGDGWLERVGNGWLERVGNGWLEGEERGGRLRTLPDCSYLRVTIRIYHSTLFSID